MEDDFGFNLKNIVNSSVTILPSKQILVGDRLLWDLRALKEVVIPEGVERIAGYWFSSSVIESIEIAASVRELDANAFHCCKKLRSISFQTDSRLWKIGDGCFEYSGLKEFIAPPGLREIGDAVFWNCSNLKRVALNEGLEALDDQDDDMNYGGTFSCSGIEEITLPSTLRRMSQMTFFGCNRLRTIDVKSGCQADFSGLELSNFTITIPLGEVIGDVCL